MYIKYFLFLSFALCNYLSAMNNIIKLASYFSPTTMQAYKDKYLLTAAADGNIDNMEYWLSSGAYLEAKDSEGRTPLALALETCHTLRSAEFLLKQGAHPNTNSYASPLHMAFDNCNIEMIKMLLKHGAHIDISPIGSKRTILFRAAHAFLSSITITLLSYGASVKDSSILPIDTSHMLRYQIDGLCIGHEVSYPKTVKALLYAGLDPYKEDSKGNIPAKLIAELIGYDDVKEIVKNHTNNKKYCTLEEIKEFDQMMKERLNNLLKKNNKNICNLLISREINIKKINLYP